MPAGHNLKKRPRTAASPAITVVTTASSTVDTAATSAVPGGFNDAASSDVLLRLLISPDPDSTTDVSSGEFDLHLHAHALRRSQYFSALLSDRWRGSNDRDPITLPATPSTIDAHLTVLRLLYSPEFSEEISTPAAAIAVLPVALALLFEDLVRACVRFLEAVPWSDEEESAVLTLAPLLPSPDSADILARLSPVPSPPEETLHRLISASVGSPKIKSFAAKMLRDFSSREVARRVFDRAFAGSLKAVRDSLERYASPEFRGDHDETEAIQRLNLHSASSKVKDLLWLLELMIELRVADAAVEEWSSQAAFVADLERAFVDDVWRNNAPALPALVMKCTSLLAHAMVAGSVLAPREVRLKLVSVWLPLLIVCRDKNASPLLSNQRELYQDLEETFLRIISTLPMSDSETLLHHCLSFATRNVDECPHLVAAFNTYFRRSMRPPLSLGDAAA